MTQAKRGAPGKGNKEKLLTFLQILEEQTDENHRLRMQNLLEEMEDRGCRINRKFVYENISLLREMGYKVDCADGGYGFTQRRFELAELRLLADAVQCAGFIQAQKRQRLVDKLKTLGSVYQKGEMGQQIFAAESEKYKKEHTLYAIDNIHTAIQNNCMLSFHYYIYDIRNIRHPKRDGKLYHVSPYAMAWYDGYCYLICSAHGQNSLSHYRVDRMGDTQVQFDVPRVDFRFVSPYRDFFDTADYVKKHLSMPGETQTVTLLMENSLLDAFVDRFGADAPIRVQDEGHFKVQVEAAPTRAFLECLIRFGPGAEVLHPKSFRNYIRRELTEMLEHYSN